MMDEARNASRAPQAAVVVVERWVLETVIKLNAVGVPMTGDVIEPIRRAIAAADKIAGGTG